MNQLYHQEPNKTTLEGNAAHELGAKMIVSLSRARYDYPEREDVIGTLATNGEMITEEIYEAAELYANTVGEKMRELGVFNPYIEHRVTAKALHEMSYGTLDVGLFSKAAMELYIYDFKYGHKYVSEFMNWQLINYTAGMLEKLGINGIQDQYLTVHLVVVQPRAYGQGGSVRTWSIKASDLRPYFNQLSAAFHKALSNEYEFNTGSHCYQCPGIHACDSAIQAGMTLFEVSSNKLPINPPMEAISLQLQIVERALEQLGFIQTGLSEQLESKLRAGKSDPRYSMQNSYGRKTWSKSNSTVINLGKMYNVDLRKQDPITPKQAIAKGLDPEVVEQFSYTPNKGMVLKPIDNNKAKRIFQNA